MITETTVYSKMKEGGTRFLFIRNFNRDINERALKSLKASVKKTRMYLSPIQVMKVSTYREIYHDKDLVDPENNMAVVNRTDEKDTDFVVLDGQHRLTVHFELLKEANENEESLAFDLSVNVIALPEGMEPHRYIYTLNTTSTQWTDKDRTKFINASESERTGLKVAEEWQKEHGLGIRNATAIIQLSDSYKASMQKDFMENKRLDSFLKSTPVNIARGEKIFKSLQIGFGNQTKLLKNMSPILSIIEVYNQTADDAKPEVIEQLCLFFKTLNKDDVERIVKLSGTMVKKNEFICLWNAFKKDFDLKKTFQETVKAEALLREEEYTREHESPKKQTSKKAK